MSALFAHPWLLAGLVLAGLPWLIEWLFRRRRRQVDLPTIVFLLRNKDQKKIKRQDRILLIVRTLAILFLVFAVARPRMRRGAAGGGRERRIAILLDGTESMNQQAGLTTAFGLAQRQATAILRGVEDEGRATIATWASTVQPVVENEQDLYTASARLDALRVGLGAAPASEGVVWMRDTLKRDGIEGAEVYIFSDYQKTTWMGPDAAQAADAFRELARDNDVYMVDVGSSPEFNYMVTDFRPTEWVMTFGLPVTFNVAIETWGTAPDDASPTVTFLVDGMKRGVRQFTPSGRTVLQFEHSFVDAGEHLVEVLVDGDKHLVDNRRSYLCTVPERFRVLVLDESAPSLHAMPGEADSDGDGGGVDYSRESAYLVRAIEPDSHPGLPPLSRFTAKVIHPSAIVYENLGDYAVVVLTQLSALDNALAARLEGRVRDGGAMWAFLGPRVNVYDYDRFLYRDGEGPFPGKLGARSPVPGSGVGETNELHVTFGQSPHPAASALTEFTGSDALILGRFELEPAPGARTVFKLSDGSPAMLESRFGRGRVMVANMTAGAGWTYLPGTPEFPILVQEVLRYLVGNPDAAVNLEAGQAFEQPVFVSQQHLLLQMPDGQRARLTPLERPDSEQEAWYVRFDGTEQQGIYELLDVPAGTVPRTRFVVNQVSSEGELERLSEADFASVFGRSGYRWVGQDTPIEDLASKLHAVTDFSPLLLAALTFLLATETYLAWRFGRRRRRGTTV